MGTFDLQHFNGADEPTNQQPSPASLGQGEYARCSTPGQQVSVSSVPSQLLCSPDCTHVSLFVRRLHLLAAGPPGRRDTSPGLPSSGAWPVGDVAARLPCCGANGDNIICHHDGRVLPAAVHQSRPTPERRKRGDASGLS